MSTQDDSSLHLRIKAIQSQIRIAVQNHQILYERLQASPNDSEVAAFIQVIQDLLLSMGRTQMELLYQYKHEIRQKYPKDEQKGILMSKLGWPDRFAIKPKNHAKGMILDPDKRYQILRKKQMLPTRPGVKMQSLLKVNNSNNSSSNSILLPRKESERIKAAAASKLLEASVVKPVKNLNAPLKIKNDKITSAAKQQDASPMLRRSSISNDKSGKLPKDSATIGAGKKMIEVTTIGDLSQDNYLQYFGLIHKDKSKNIVVNQRKRKRRSAAGQSNFYNDYYQPKKLNSKKSPTPSSVPESPCSSQDVIDMEEDEDKSAITVARVDKSSVSSSPEDIDSELKEEPSKSQNTVEKESKLPNGLPEVSQDNGSDSVLADENIKSQSVSVDPIGSPGHSLVSTDNTSADAKEADTTVLKEDMSKLSESPSSGNDGVLVIDDSAELTSVEEKSSKVELEPTLDETVVDGVEEDKPTIVDSPGDLLVKPKSPVDSSPGKVKDEVKVIEPTESVSQSIAIENASPSPPNPSEEEVRHSPEEAQKVGCVCVICCEGSASGNFEKCNQCSEYFHTECNTSSSSTCPLCYSFPPSISTIVGVTSSSPTLTTSSDCSEVVKRYLGEHEGQTSNRDN